MKKETKQLPSIGDYMARWLPIIAIIGLSTGASSAFFLKSLTYAIDVRLANPWLLFILPISGVVFTYFYTYFGKSANRGNNLVIEQGNGGGEDIPLCLISLTLLGIIAIHLSDGPVGREGTAIQVGGVIANTAEEVFKLLALERQVIIISGINVGFSSASGTPLAGTVFGPEVLVIGKVRARAPFPSFLAGLSANFVAESFGVTHTHYPMGEVPIWSVELLVKLFLTPICLGLVGWVSSRSIVSLKETYADWFANVYLRAFLGASIVVLFVLVLNNQRYLGLSLSLLEDAFAGNVRPFDFAGKLFFTVLSLGVGFQGGEVTPLFEVGATLGNSLAPLLHLSIPFLTGLGSIGIFSGVTNAPITCFIMGIKLFDSGAAVYSLVVYLISFTYSGNSGIYVSQQSLYRKGTVEYPPSNALKSRRR